MVHSDASRLVRKSTFWSLVKKKKNSEKSVLSSFHIAHSGASGLFFFLRKSTFWSLVKETNFSKVSTIVLWHSTFRREQTFADVCPDFCMLYCGVTTSSRLLQMIGLFCKRALWTRRYSAKETYHFKEPTNRSHPTHEMTIVVYIKWIHTSRNDMAHIQTLADFWGSLPFEVSLKKQICQKSVLSSFLIVHSDALLLLKKSIFWCLIKETKFSKVSTVVISHSTFRHERTFEKVYLFALLRVRKSIF